jgi:hypothetical protein
MNKYVITIYVETDLPDEDANKRLNDWIGYLQLQLPVNMKSIYAAVDEVEEI